MYQILKYGSTVVNLLIVVGIATVLLIGTAHGKLILEWVGVDSIGKTPLGYIVSERQFKKANQILALNIYHEARGEGIEGMLAVAHVVINRVESVRFPNSIGEVIKEGGEIRDKCQFSWWCDGRRDTPNEGKEWKLAQVVAREILQGIHKDNTKEAVLYHNPITSFPCWGKASTYTKTIGSHKFFSDIPWPELKRLCK